MTDEDEGVGGGCNLSEGDVGNADGGCRRRRVMLCSYSKRSASWLV